MRILLLALIAAALLSAQPTVAPTTAPVSSPRGENIGGYNILNSFETGYRWHTIGGNEGKYRSDVNFGNGLRLLGSSLTVNSREGHGGWLDELLLNTQGLGNDPYQFANFRIQKNRIYRYEMLWREQEYFNPALSISAGQHFMNTSRRLQDHSLVLLPQSAFRLIAGYSRNVQDGPALSTVNLFDIRGDEFALFRDVRWTQDEYRLGAELSLGGAKLNFTRAWEFFRDDTRQGLTEPSAGNNPGNVTTLNTFRRDEPWHGSARHWRVHLLYDRSKLWGLTGRYAWAGARQNFVFDEFASGVDRAARSRQTLIFGNARRPVSAANLTLNLFPAEQLAVVNHTSFHHTRMEGDSNYTELNNATLGFESINFRFLGIRALANTTTFDYRPSTRVAFHAGYHVANRRIRARAQNIFGAVPEQAQSEQTNTLNSGIFGVRLRPVRPFQISLDAEIGRANRSFFPVSERNYHAFSGRVQYKTRTLLLSAAARTLYNTVPVSLASHSARSRNWFADASWSPAGRFAIDASWARLHVDTLTGIAYFLAGELQRHPAWYISNIHSGTLSGRFAVTDRAEVMIGYSRITDTGGDDQRPVPRGVLPDLAGQTYPLTFESPLARVSVRLHPKLRWNAGYQHYGYRESFLRSQNYRAHTGYTSLSWSF